MDVSDIGYYVNNETRIIILSFTVIQNVVITYEFVYYNFAWNIHNVKAAHLAKQGINYK